MHVVSETGCSLCTYTSFTRYLDLVPTCFGKDHSISYSFFGKIIHYHVKLTNANRFVCLFRQGKSNMHTSLLSHREELYYTATSSTIPGMWCFMTALGHQNYHHSQGQPPKSFLIASISTTFHCIFIVVNPSMSGITYFL